MYTRVAGTTFTAGVVGGTLAKTGFYTLTLVALALCLLSGGLVLMRVALVRRQALAGELA